MAIDTTRFSIRADWYAKTMKFLLKNSNKGLIVLNEFAEKKLLINPANTEQGVEFDKFLQGLEDRQLIFYKVKEIKEGGFKAENRCLNTVQFSAVLQNEGWTLMSEVANADSIRILTKISMLTAIAALCASLGSLYYQSKSTTDEELKKLNTELQHRRLLQNQGTFQQGIDASLNRIVDSVGK